MRARASARSGELPHSVPARELLCILEEGSHVFNNIPHVYRPLVAGWVVDRLRA